jgi:hypothetical protein
MHSMLVLIQADNGEVYRIMALQVPYDRTAPITAEVYDNDRQLVILTFDCRGHFSQRIGFEGNWRNIPSRSVVAKISQISCYQAKGR